MSHEIQDGRLYIRKDIGVVDGKFVPGIFVEPLGGNTANVNAVGKVIEIYTRRVDGFIPNTDRARTLHIANHILHQ